MAKQFEVTSTAVRQHLDDLETGGVVESSEPISRGGRGRPAVVWSLTPGARTLFPDRHADLTVELIDSIREALGDDGLDTVITTRSARQRAAYANALDGTPVRLRASALAEMRTAEGYLAEIVDNDDGSLILVEHHCPICDAAAACQNLCRDELATFESLFDGQATVEREQHLLGGDKRCAYRITEL